MVEADSPLEPAGRGPSGALVATFARWLAVGLTLEMGLGAAVEALLLFTHREGSAGTFAWPLGLGATVGLLLIFATLRAEESRLARELRTARTGTPVLRAVVARRRAELPFFARWSSSKLGTAAVLLADGDRDGALDALRTASVFMRAGRLEKLRAIVEADVERKTGTAASLGRCVQRLRAAPRIGNREADLYRVHVLVKAVLEQGDAETAVELIGELAPRGDDEERVYATWLRVWFELDDDAPTADEQDAVPVDGEDRDVADGAVRGQEESHGDAGGERPRSGEWPALSEGDLRMAVLAARVHGAESLVSKLTRRLSAIARADLRG